MWSVPEIEQRSEAPPGVWYVDEHNNKLYASNQMATMGCVETMFYNYYTGKGGRDWNSEQYAPQKLEQTRPLSHNKRPKN